MYNSPTSFKPSLIIRKVTTNLKTYIHSRWKSKLNLDIRKNNSGNKLRTYRKFKNMYTYEKYLDIVKDTKLRKTLTQFRTSSHSLNIEKGRYTNIPEEERTCPYCPNQIENEEHFLVNCNKYADYRTLLFNYVEKYSKSFVQMSNENKFIFIMANENIEIVRALADYLYKSFQLRSSTV
jgi:hypothetical protein